MEEKRRIRKRVGGAYRKAEFGAMCCLSLVIK